ncbi:MAG TPA: metabolite traffic protein EboE [Verrucomicrobiales bacterium]|nr:metabolite traffic protein EboE [Verrucomicrobiales bacterium]
MELARGLHLAYCTNIHRGENWSQTFAGLQHCLQVRDAVAPGRRFAIGLRLSARAAEELSDPGLFASFLQWLAEHDCYVFTINGFPYGNFHGTRVKEQVYRPDWTRPERLAYTLLLFDLLSRMLAPGAEGSISTCPGSFKSFPLAPNAEAQMHAQFHACALHLEKLSAETGHDLHLGLEPEPLCSFETSEETVAFLQRLFAAYPADDDLLRRRIGVNYDCCHLAVEFEHARDAIARFRAGGIRLSKLHLSSALRLTPTPANLDRLRAFDDPVYLHQVVIRSKNGDLKRFEDLQPALDFAGQPGIDPGEEWRVHFHIPLHHEPSEGLASTRDHLIDILDLLAEGPAWCRHLEMETYTWEVLPEALRQHNVVDQLVLEYEWTLAALRERGLEATPSPT